MENLLIRCSIQNPATPVSTKQLKGNGISPDLTTSSSSSASMSFPPKLIDSHLNHLIQNGRLNDAVSVLDSLPQSPKVISSSTFLNLIQSCTDLNSITLGRKVHRRMHLVEDTTPILETKLVGMYAKCGCLSEARKLFGEIREKDLYAWSAMIGACSREKRWEEVVELFHMMMAEGNNLPDGFLFPKILQACGNSGKIETGVLIHCLAVKLGLTNTYPRVNNSILSVYAKCGKLDLARRIFETMDARDTVAWNAMISGYCHRGEVEEARKLFGAMCEEGIEPCSVTWNILIAGYNQRGCCDVAMELMRKMESSGISPDVVAWTSMISGFAQNGRRKEALDLLKEMILAGVEPNGVTIASATSACASLKLLDKGLEIHSLAVRLCCAGDLIVGNSLVDLYSKCGELDAARQVFDMMFEKDIYTWNSMIGGYCQVGLCGKAYVLFMNMLKSDVRPDVITWNTMISGYMQNRDEDQAMDLFQRMEKDGKIKRDNASWNSLISGYLQIGQKDKALGIFRQMQSFSVSLNAVSILSVLPACATLVALKKVKEIHGCVLRRNLDSQLSIANSLIDSYAKVGYIEYSRTIFDRMPSKDQITWNSLIAGYVLHGRSDAALFLTGQMRELVFKPTRGTFVSIILAHSLAGLVEEGKHVFASMMGDHQIMPALEHYSAMVDLYGRSGRLEEAIECIEAMPIKPDSTVWSALLTASRIHGNVELAIRARESLLDLEPWNHLVHRSYLQLYALHANPEEASKEKTDEKENKVPKLTGQSWVEVENTVHSFVSGDCSKLHSDQFSWVESISSESMVHDPNSRLCIEEEVEEKEEIVGVHSEKLALAFSFVCASSAPQSVRIVKNLRICGDCHRMAKYVSMKYGCEIYLSDSKCFHHFKYGSCSCGDYW